MAVVILAACQAASADVDFGIDDTAPIEIGAGGSTNLLFVTTLEDCFGCRIQGGFVALRSAQRTGDSAFAPRLTALLVARSLDDTLAFSQTLQYERITARIKTMTPREAGRIFDLGRIPAIYLLEDGRVVREWQSGGQTVLVIGRNDITGAVAEIRNAQAKQ